jgi:hypothetical protein
LNLLAVREGLAGTEIDEVIWADKGDRFTRCRSRNVDLLNDRWVQSKGRLGITIAAILIVVAAILVVIATILVVILVIGRGWSSAVVATVLIIGRGWSGAVIATILVVIVTAVLVVVVAAVLVVVATLTVIATLTVVAAKPVIAAKSVVLAGHKTMGLWNEEGAGQLGCDKENEGKPDALHDSSQTKRRGNRIGETGRKDGVGSKQASLSKG